VHPLSSCSYVKCTHIFSFRAVPKNAHYLYTPFAGDMRQVPGKVGTSGLSGTLLNSVLCYKSTEFYAALSAIIMHFTMFFVWTEIEKDVFGCNLTVFFENYCWFGHKIFLPPSWFWFNIIKGMFRHNKPNTLEFLKICFFSKLFFENFNCKLVTLTFDLQDCQHGQSWRGH
jgi:hypothetical protein